MSDDQIDALVNTLLANNLASSPTEAKKMAQDMLGTAQKVNDGFQRQNSQNMSQPQQPSQTPNSSIQEKNVPPKTPTGNPPQPYGSDSKAMQARVNELRESAMNPQPVDVQVDFQTPASSTQAQPSPEDQLSVPGLDPNMSLSELANQAVDQLNQNPVPSGPLVVEDTQKTPSTPTQGAPEQPVPALARSPEAPPAPLPQPVSLPEQPVAPEPVPQPMPEPVPKPTSTIPPALQAIPQQPPIASPQPADEPPRPAPAPQTQEIPSAPEAPQQDFFGQESFEQSASSQTHSTPASQELPDVPSPKIPAPALESSPEPVSVSTPEQYQESPVQSQESIDTIPADFLSLKRLEQQKEEQRKEAEIELAQTLNESFSSSAPPPPQPPSSEVPVAPQPPRNESFSKTEITPNTPVKEPEFGGPQNTQIAPVGGIPEQPGSSQNPESQLSPPPTPSSPPVSHDGKPLPETFTPERKPVEFTEEEKKLKEDVDLSKVFNSRN